MLPWILPQHIFKNQKRTVATITVCLVTVLFLFFSAVPAVVHAQGGADTFGLEPVEGSTVLASTDIRIIIAQIVRAVLGLLGIIAVGLILYAGYTIMTSGGNEDKVSQGKRVLVNAVIGLAIILSAVAIVQFVLNALNRATGRVGDITGGRAPRLDTFVGSGSLGRIIKDHYPVRDEEDVKRNTKIAVTFREPIAPASLIVDANGNGRIGDCIAVAPSTGPYDWARNCDRLNTSSVRISPTAQSGSLVEAAALATYEGPTSSTFTVVFRPLDLLGSATTTVEYTVILTDRIRKADGQTSAFVNTRDGRYVWRFETSTKFDPVPPSVVAIYPRNLEVIPRNSVIQITFDDAMDPTTVQGQTATFTNILFGNGNASPVLPQGEWRLTNGYRTVEFVSNDACGQNSCGDIMYCLQLNCPPGSTAACRNQYAVLLRTAEVLGGNTFEAIPFTGIMDIAGNALDGGPDSTRQSPSGVIPGDGILATPHKPSVNTNPRIFTAGELAPDNFWWGFTVENRIDRSTPYIQSTRPGIDEEDVAEDAPLTINFSHFMWASTLSTIAIEEFPADTNAVDPIWFYVRSGVRPDAPATTVNIRHRIFGPNDTDRYYFTSIPSTVRSVNQNCLYPGRGPVSALKNTAPTCVFETNENGVPIANTGLNCVPNATATTTSSTDSGCVQTTLQQENLATNLLLQPDTASCLNVMRRPDISSVAP